MQAWLLKYLWPLFLDKLFKTFSAWVSDLIRQQKEAKQNADAVKKYTEVVSNPNTTREERKNAEDDFINR